MFVVTRFIQHHVTGVTNPPVSLFFRT